MRKYLAIGTACAALSMTGCDGGKAEKMETVPPSPDTITMESLKSLSEKKIFFGHQSVGWNIIDGLKEIAREKGWAGFTFVETRTPRTAPGFYHCTIGQNGDPLGKIKDFESIIRGGMGDRVDIALMKFCYVDFGPETDSEAVFSEYRATMNRLEAEYPKVTFVRVTVPLCVDAPEKGLKASIMHLLGKVDWSVASNVARERINSLIRADCSKNNRPLYDLALSESTSAQGVRIEIKHGGKTYYALRDEYTTDGGHLNAQGQMGAALSMMNSL
jgi:hypothetical protein